MLLLDCPLEYKKGDSNANVEITKEGGLEHAVAHRGGVHRATSAPKLSRLDRTS